MPESPIQGGCSCGSIRYRSAGPALVKTNCHCSNCRRAVGAPSVAWIIVDRKGFAFTSGQPNRYRTDSGARRSFCGSCGTSLTYESDHRPGQIDITTGSLDEPESHAPDSDHYEDERLPWVPLLG